MSPWVFNRTVVFLLDSVRRCPSLPPPRAAPRRRLAPSSPADCHRLEPRERRRRRHPSSPARAEDRTERHAELFFSGTDDSSSPALVPGPHPRHRRPPSPARSEDRTERRAELRSSPAQSRVIVVPSHACLLAKK